MSQDIENKNERSPQESTSADNHPQEKPTKDHTPDILCMISILCEIVPFIMDGVFTGAVQTLSYKVSENPGLMMIRNLIGSLAGIGFVAGIVLLIIVRVKYPQNTFGKVLMWVYIVFAVLCFLAFFLFLVACSIACNGASSSCFSCLQDMGRIG